jgi:hypothetical protein
VQDLGEPLLQHIFTSFFAKHHLFAKQKKNKKKNEGYRKHGLPTYGLAKIWPAIGTYPTISNSVNRRRKCPSTRMDMSGKMKKPPSANKF